MNTLPELIKCLSIVILKNQKIGFSWKSIECHRSLQQKFEKGRMGILKKMKDLIKMNDFFYSTQMLRFNDESDYKTLTGGLISLAIIVIIMIGFSTMIADTISLNSITSSTDIINQEIPTLANFSTNADSNFMFAVNIPYLNIASSYHYFDIKLYRAERGYNLASNYTQITLEPCTKRHWRNYPYAYEKLSYQYWLCAPIDTTFSIQGKLTSPDYDYYYVGVYPCYKGSNATKQCATATQVSDFFNNRSNRAELALYIINPVINPSRKEYKSLYLEDRNFLIFGPNIGSAARLYLTDYTIKSDESIMPFESIKEESGMLLEKQIRSYNFEVTSNSAYATFTFLKSQNSIVFNREVQKISAVFSFIGGMIGAVTAALFIVKMYTSAAYQISLALDIFEPSQDSKLKKSNLVMNFWNYIKLTIFNIFKLFKRQRNWPAIAYINECQQQIINQLDVKSLVKRLIFMQHCLNILFEDYQLDGLKCNKPQTPSEIKEIREKCEQIVSNEFDSQQEPSQSADGIFKDDSNYQLNDQIGNKQIPNHSKISPLSLQMKRQSGSPVQMMMGRQNEKILDHAKAGDNGNIAEGANHQQRRKNFINMLRKDANEGNRLSKKILNLIQQELKKNQQRR